MCSIDFRFAFLLNKKFRFTITFQFIVSTLVVCFTLYQLTKTSGKFVELGMYMSCMLTQIFLYCWYANEVKLKVIYIFFQNGYFSMLMFLISFYLLIFYFLYYLDTIYIDKYTYNVHILFILKYKMLFKVHKNYVCNLRIN